MGKLLAVLLVFMLCNQDLCFAQKQLSAPKRTLEEDTTATSLSYEQKKPLEQAIRRSADLEVDGLIVDETITKVGRDFYSLFQMKWEAPPLAQNFTILIKEQPTRGTGTVVSVAINDEKVFEQALQPRYDLIQEVVNYVVAAAHQYLLEDQLNRQLEAEGKKAREVF